RYLRNYFLAPEGASGGGAAPSAPAAPAAPAAPSAPAQPGGEADGEFSDLWSGDPVDENGMPKPSEQKPTEGQPPAQPAAPTEPKPAPTAAEIAAETLRLQQQQQ